MDIRSIAESSTSDAPEMSLDNAPRDADFNCLVLYSPAHIRVIIEAPNDRIGELIRSEHIPKIHQPRIVIQSPHKPCQSDFTAVKASRSSYLTIGLTPLADRYSFAAVALCGCSQISRS